MGKFKTQVTEAVEPSYKEVTLNVLYRSQRAGGKTVEVYPVEVKGNKVKVKRALGAVDSQKMSRAEFDRYFQLVG